MSFKSNIFTNMFTLMNQHYTLEGSPTFMTYPDGEFRFHVVIEPEQVLDSTQIPPVVAST